MTPRQTRQRHQQGASQAQPQAASQAQPQSASQAQTQPPAIQPSDYESDVYVPPPAPLTTRTNTELNLSVLRRHHPSITAILSIAPSAQIYTYAGMSWNKTDIEGTLFVCQTAGDGDGDGVGYVVVVLNRRGLENLVVDVGRIENVEVTEQFLMVGFRGDGEGEGAEGEVKVLGFFIHADRTETREVNCRLIREKWEEVRGARGGGNRNGNGNGGGVEVEVEGGMGRRLSLTDLFGGQLV